MVAVLLVLLCLNVVAAASFVASGRALHVTPPRNRRCWSPGLQFRSPFPPREPSSAPPGLYAQSFGDGTDANPWPVKTMVFIDGSWLYYSLHGRRPNCPVTRTLGAGWEYSHTVDYERLPQLISRHIHEELLRRHGTQRFVEVVRTVVFASAKADTHRDSHRLRMFRAMTAAGFEVHLGVTTGAQEKCIDIALAVEMMHFASQPGAYDTAVLLSGDKDFMPALSRIRQKGKRTALCSMRNCCSRDLVEPGNHVRDFEPIWLDDHLNELLVPSANLEPAAAPSQGAALSGAQLMRLVTAYLRKRGGGGAADGGGGGVAVSSRDIGRHLQGDPLQDSRLPLLSHSSPTVSRIARLSEAWKQSNRTQN